ncbi:Gfo/Idh/MocA family protein [Anaeromassilibacillus senegalensis]|uniref:Gfo/Idh/MocA family oxidoreductase n=1 Tax=Anaeromassilibacillus senegalensis TaxID=1673717 RepID=A0ABS9CMR0_9FIRM|nr:Gfo/Idh/MocA family oxidoreductase [Anaeromassilibacillus senegalensis]MCF2652419.1 Gfo/Idh/MocA family oxidoreductase [Anaeromassilibacillus senegalensis]
MKTAILGTWHVHTEEYTRAILANPQAEAAVIWDSDIPRGKAFAEKLGIPFTDDLDGILNDASIDSVVVCSATCDHPELLTKAANAGKNIFTEKVLTIGVEDAEKVAAAVKAAGKVFTISYPHRTFPTLRAAKALLDSGKLGTVTYARVRNVHNGSSADWLPPHFYDKAQCGGGAMIDLGAHPMYTLYWLLGEPKTITSTFTEVTHRGVEDNAVSVIEFANGAIGVSETGFVSECNPYTLEISGTDGAMMIHGESAQWGGKATGGKWVDLELPEKMQLPVDQWVDAVTNGTPSPFTIDEAVMLTRLMDGAYKSFESGTKFTF